MLDVEEQTLVNELNKLLRQKFKTRTAEPTAQELPEETSPQPPPKSSGPESQTGYYQERELVKLLLQYGSKELVHEYTDEQGFPASMSETAARYIIDDLLNDQLWFNFPLHRKIQEHYAEALKEEVIPSEKFFVSHPDPALAQTSIDLITTPYRLDNWESKNIFVKTEEDVLKQVISETLLRFKDLVVEARLHEVLEKMKQTSDFDDQLALLLEKKKLDGLRQLINSQLGITIIK